MKSLMCFAQSKDDLHCLQTPLPVTTALYGDICSFPQNRLMFQDKTIFTMNITDTLRRVRLNVSV